MADVVQAGARSVARGVEVALDDHLGDVTAFLELDGAPGDSAVQPDVSVLLLAADGQVRSDEDFVFYNQPVWQGGAVRLHRSTDHPAVSQTPDAVALDLGRVTSQIERLVLVASLDAGSDTGGIPAMRFRVHSSPDSRELLTYDIEGDDPAPAVLVGEFYRHGGSWGFRALGRPRAGGLGAVAAEFGVDVGEDDSEAISSSAQPSKADADPSEASSTHGLGETDRRQVSVRRPAKPPRMPTDWEHSLTTRQPDEPIRARLISVVGIAGAQEQERRATSALLAVASLVRPFGHRLFRPLGAPAGPIDTYVEVPFKLDGKPYRPDGLVIAHWGKRTWQCLVEVKTGSAQLSRDQVEAYVEIAREHGLDAVLTISNEVTGAFGEHPVSIDKRKLRRVQLHHLSWDDVRAHAILLTRHTHLSDATAAEVLRHFVRYLQHNRSGLHGFVDMGPNWAKVRDAVRSRALSPSAQSTADVCQHYDQLMRHLALHLTALLGVDIDSTVPRDTPDQATRRQQLADSGVLFGSLKIPGVPHPVVLRADLRAERVNASLRVAAPRRGRRRTRVTWLLRQLTEARGAARVEAFTTGAKIIGSRSLQALRDDPDALLSDDAAEIREFGVSIELRMGTKRGIGRGSFIESTVDAVVQFYAEVVQHTRVWSP